MNEKTGTKSTIDCFSGMNSDGKRYRFFLAETGEIIYTVTFDNEASEKKLDEIRLQLAYDKGFEANSIDYDEE